MLAREGLASHGMDWTEMAAVVQQQFSKKAPLLMPFSFITSLMRPSDSAEQLIIINDSSQTY